MQMHLAGKGAATGTETGALGLGSQLQLGNQRKLADGEISLNYLQEST